MRSFSVCVFLAATLLFAGRAQAIPIGTVGSVDTFLASTDLSNSGEETERLWIASVLGVEASTLIYDQLEGSGGEDNAWLSVDGFADLWAFDFQAFDVSNPAWFLVRLGNATDTHYLYSNIAELRYGVIDLGEFDARRGQITIASVSHTGAAGGTASVPEPGSLSLVLLGLAAAGASVRRRRRS